MHLLAVGRRGGVLGMDRFGASAPGGVLAEKFGFTPERVAEAARGLLTHGSGRSER